MLEFRCSRRQRFHPEPQQLYVQSDACYVALWLPVYVMPFCAIVLKSQRAVYTKHFLGVIDIKASNVHMKRNLKEFI